MVLDGGWLGSWAYFGVRVEFWKEGVSFRDLGFGVLELRGGFRV